MKDKEEDKRVAAKMKIVWHRDGSRNNVSDINDPEKLADEDIIDYNGKIEIKYRGNSSYHHSDKKPFAVKTIKDNGKKLKVPILGMGEDNDWALLAPFADKSMIRDVLIFDLMKDGYMEYVPTGRYCELVLNGVYQGTYIMAARVRTGDYRIDIPSPKKDGDALTGGYLLEIDRNDGDDGFFSKQDNYSLTGNTKTKTFYQHKSPDGDDYAEGEMDAQRAYIENHVHTFESVMAGNDFNNPETGYPKYLNTTSVIEYIIAQEFTRNSDGYRLSTPMYKKRDSVDPRFQMSIWDFNISFGNADYYDGWSTEGWAHNFNRLNDSEPGNYVPFWMKKLLNDDEFQAQLKSRWNEARSTNLSNSAIEEKIDSLVSLLSESQQRNFTIWPILDKAVWPNAYVGGSWSKEIEYLKSFITKRLDWLDSQWKAEYSENLLANGSFEEEINPLVINKLSTWDKSNYNCGVSDNCHSGQKSILFRGYSSLWQTITELKTGKYTLEFWVKTEGSPNGSVSIRKDGKNPQRLKDIDNNRSDYFKVEINDINITDGNWDILFSTSGQKMYIDDVRFYRTDRRPNSIESALSDEYSVKVKTGKGKVIFDINSLTENNVNIEIFSVNGAKISQSDKVFLNAGQNSVSINIPGNSGLYLYRIIGNKHSSSGKFSL